MTSLLYAISRCSPVYAVLFATLSCCLLPPKKDRLPLRAGICTAVFVLLSAFILFIPEGKPYTIYLEMVYYYCLYLVTGGILLICFEGSVYDVAYICAMGNICQHTLYTLCEILALSAAISGHPLPVGFPVVSGVVVLYALSYLLLHLLLKKHYRNTVPLYGSSELLLAGLLLPLPLMALNLVITAITSIAVHLLFYRIHMLLMCTLYYLMLSSVQRLTVTRQEAERIREANLRQKEQYEFKKEVIERVNLRAHDLKKQLDRLEHSGKALDPVTIGQIRDELQRYDQLVETGNETLDTILADVLLRCEQLQVRFSYLIDGTKLSFVQPIDLYAIFGNLLDNALTAVARLERPEERIVSLQMTEKGDCLYFHVFNACADEPSFENGLPKTTKPDAENHGFGTRSVRASVRKYGGELLISAENGVFHVNFMLKKQ